MFGGILAQKYQNKVLKQKEDRNRFLEALDILIELEPELDDFQASPDDVKNPCKCLLNIARRIENEKNYELAIMLIEFAQKDVRHTREYSNELIDKLVAEISKPLYMFRKKQNELFKKAAEELKSKRK